MKILIVDDSKTMRMIIIRTLRKTSLVGHTVLQAGDGREALQVIATDSPDVVVSDWNMPEMTGLQFLRQLRGQGNAVNFGFVTSESTLAMREQAAEAGARFFVTKPFTPESLEASLSPVLV